MRNRRPNRPRARSRLGDSEQLLERKQRQLRRQATNGRPNGLVEVPGPLPSPLEAEIRSTIASVARREAERDSAAAVLDVFTFARGIAVETTTEKLAQHIADAIARSRHAQVIRTFDDEGQRRILTCHLPSKDKK